MQFQTWDDRRRNLENHVVPRLGGVALQDVAPDQVNRMYAELLRDGHMRNDGGLSPTSVRRIHAILRKALNDAVRWGLVRRNVVLAGVNPKVVSERLGHSSVAFTLDTYAHVMPGMQPEAAEQFSDLVWGDPSDDQRSA